MIELYGGSSPNAMKVVLMLEEIEKPYVMRKVDTFNGEQFSDEFMKLNPLSKYPVLLDPDGPAKDTPMFESGAILIYLAETYGRSLLPEAGPSRWRTLMWLIAQVAHVGPMLGQHNHFLLHPGEAETYAAQRYAAQARRVYSVLDGRLAENAYLAGGDYSIADIATYPWSEYVVRQGFGWDEFPHIAVWRRMLMQRPAIQRTEDIWARLSGRKKGVPKPTEQQADIFFGRTHGPRPESDFSALDRNRLMQDPTEG